LDGKQSSVGPSFIGFWLETAAKFVCLPPGQLVNVRFKLLEVPKRGEHVEKETADVIDIPVACTIASLSPLFLEFFD
jgi:hypothetical protein